MFSKNSLSVFTLILCFVFSIFLGGVCNGEDGVYRDFKIIPRVKTLQIKEGNCDLSKGVSLLFCGWRDEDFFAAKQLKKEIENDFKIDSEKDAENLPVVVIGQIGKDEKLDEMLG